MPREKEGGKRKECELGVSRPKCLYIKYINNKAILYRIENYIQYPMINHNGKEYLKKNVHVSINESLCYTAEIKPHFKSTILQFKN